MNIREAWVFVVFIITISCNNKEQEFYEGGELKQVFELNSDNERDGTFTEYYKSGSLKSRGNWKDGVIEGKVTHYFPNGEVKEISNWKGGKLNGTSIYYFENGAMKLKSDFIEGKKEGSAHFFSKDGDVIERHLYKRDKLFYISKTVNGEVYESLLPILSSDSDTIKLGDPYVLNASFGIQLRGEVTIYIGKLGPGNSVLKDTIGVLVEKNGYSYKFLPKQTGSQTIDLTIAHEDSEDSLSMDGLSLKHTFFVQDTVL